MPQVLASLNVNKKNRQIDDLLTDVRAQIITPGGAVILAVAIVLNLILIFSLFIPSIHGVQFLIVAVLTIGCWGYLLNSFTERLRLEDGVLEFKAWLSRTKKINLHDVSSFKLTDLGLRMNGDQYLFEVTTLEDTRPVELSLGPCWDKKQLMCFINTMQLMLEEINH